MPSEIAEELAEEVSSPAEAPTPPTPSSDEEKLQAMLDQKLSTIKASLDKAYKERDEARKESAKILEEAKKAKLKKMEEEGQALEAEKIKNKDLEEKLSSLNKQLETINRDMKVQASFQAIDQEFRNKRSASVAFKEVCESLVRQEDGSWTSIDGSSIEAVVAAFAKDEDNDFLFKPKKTSGSGIPASGEPAPPKAPSSLFKLSQAEVLKLAAEGKLPKRK